MKTVFGPLAAPCRGRSSGARAALLRGVSITTLAIAAAAPARAGGPAFKSLGQALTNHVPAPVIAATNGGGAVAARQANLGAQNFANAANRFRSLSQALAAASYQGVAVPDGVQPGGLQQAVSPGSNYSTLWSGASTTLTQTLANGITDVTVNQLQSVAALTWKSFNIGAHTKLTFNQGASNWVAINSVADPTASPTTILGQISAPGKVYILNPNGILFGAGSQVNVGALIASTASVAEAQFTRDTNGLVKTFSLYGSATGTTTSDTFLPTFTDAPADTAVSVQPGAVISTPVPTGTAGGGYVMLLAGQVQNGGVISTPQGQTVLAAGTNFVLQPGYSVNNPIATVVGSQVAVTNPEGSITATSSLGSVTNSGIVIADQGDITMVGHAVTQAGVLMATTTIDNRGTVHLLTDSGDSTATITMAPGSITEIAPEELYSLSINGTSTLVTALENPNAPTGILQTALDAQRATNLSNSATDNALRSAAATGPRLNDFNDLTDTLGEGRIEISTGGNVDVQGGALALAQGGQVAVNAAGSILVENGASIDVSGTNATLPASANSLFVQGIVPYYLRDSAANRTTLEFANVYIDERTLQEITSGTYAGNIYTQGGLLEVSGNLGLIGHGINEWTSIAGQVTLQSVVTKGGVSTGGTVTVAPGATINLTGGTVTYQAGLEKQSYVQSADGRVFNINTAPGNLVYTGVYTGEAEAHPRWHITQSFINPLLTPTEIEEPAYTTGRDAGNLTVAASTALLAGTIDAGVTIGQNQTGSRPAIVSDPFLLAQSVVPLSGKLTVAGYDGGVLLQQQFASTVIIASASGTSGGNNGTPPVTLPTEAITGTIAVDSDALNTAGFANVSILTAGDLISAGSLSLADGGTLTLGGGTVAIESGITAHSGQVTLTNLLTPQLVLSSIPGSISIAPGVVIDTSGEWTNLLLDPDNHTLSGYANGGGVTAISTGGLDFAAGAAIDVSSGGQLSISGKLTAAAGGNVTLSADILPGTVTTFYPFGDVVLDGTIAGYASSTGGTLSIIAPNVVLGTQPEHIVGFNANAFVVLPDNALFSTGFSNYVLNGYFGLEVDGGRNVVATRPVYVLTNPALATGDAASGAYSVELAPTYFANVGNDTITQRPGASLALESTINPAVHDGGGGPVFIDPGATVSVDPGQSITVAAYGQLTDQGTLTAHGGTITLANTRYENASPPDNVSPNYLPGLSVWIGDTALVDASGQAVRFTDANGRVFGQAQAGGTILLGGLGGENASSEESTYAQVIVRPYAQLDAQGASLTVDSIPSITDEVLRMPVPVTLAGNGGTILARSYTGIALDGVLNVAGQGAGAAGGTLTMRMDLLDVTTLRSLLPPGVDLPPSFAQGSRILISQDKMDVQTTPYLTPGEITDPTTTLLGRISQAQLDAGGFDTLNLFAQDFIAFDGSAALHLARAVTLQSPILGETQQTGTARITAPDVRLLGKDKVTYGTLTAGGTLLTPGYSQGTLIVDAGTIDMAGTMTLGGAQSSVGSLSGFVVPGFSNADYISTGDIRFLLSPDGLRDSLDTGGNVTLQAAQIYPATAASAVIYAGDNIHIASSDKTDNEFAGGTITVLGQPGAPPAAPFSVNGTLDLISETILQDGVLRAPEGDIVLGVSNADITGSTARKVTDAVVLGPHSITSVSLDGQIVPYGGTVDGVNYTYAGAPVITFAPTIIIHTALVTAAPGAQIDLRGGGTLSGAGFIPGRGGTADVNTTPLLNSLSGTVAANTSDPVFAIVPGYTDTAAPVAPGDSGYDTPNPGEQITIAAGEIAGLAGGTYTLLPAYYDLLPGAFRVELTPAAVAPGTAKPFGNYTQIAAVEVGYAGTGVIGSVPQAALITSGAGVRQLSQYAEESYNDFEAISSATFGAARPDLPQDAKSVQILLNLPTGTIAVTQPIDIDAGSVLKTPAAFTLNGTSLLGHGATVEVSSTNELVVLGTGDSYVPSVTNNGTIELLPVNAVSDASLDALTQPVAVPFAGAADGEAEIGTRLLLGGTLTATNGTVTVTGQTPDLVLQRHAYITAADTILSAASLRGTITLLPGTTVDTADSGLVNASGGTALLFSGDLSASLGSSPLLAISNNDLQFLPTLYNSVFAQIQVDEGATLHAALGGSLNFVAPSGTGVQIAPSNLIASYVNVQVSNINVGSDATLADFASLLPGGLTLTDASLNTLAQNATILSLTAQQSVNLLGDVALNSGTTDLVLNAPAIYGYGIDSATSGAPPTVLQGGTISITAPDFVWGGVAVQNLLQTGNSTAVSATPGGRLAGSTVVSDTTYSLTDAASLTIAAAGRTASGTVAATQGTLTLGYGTQARANDQVQLDRLAAGFADVTLAASGAITANNQSSLSVYATQTTLGQPGTGGNLTLQTPLLTTGNGAVLKLNAGGIFSATNGDSAVDAVTGTITTLGGEIDVAANQIDTDTSIALPAGRLSLTADDGITIGQFTNIDLAGRATPLFDQTAYSNGGTLLVEDAAPGVSDITETAGATINVASPGGSAGLVSFTDSAGAVALDGTLRGTGATNGGSLTILAASVEAPIVNGATAFESLNDGLNGEGFSGLRAFELTSGDITVGSATIINAHTVKVAADAGNVDIEGTIDASGSTPGDIALSAGGTLTLGATSLLDAHATQVAVDSHGEPINAENRAHVALASAGGSVILAGGATINVSYPDATGQDPQGQVTIDAPRTATGDALADVAVSATGPLNIIGAKAIDLFAFRTYTPTDANGSIVQDTGQAGAPAGAVGLVQIDQDSTAYMAQVNTDAGTLAAQLAGLVTYGAKFAFGPGVEIASGTASAGNLTISGDLDLSGFRYATVPFGSGGVAVSGIPGSIIFRASNNLTVNGSVSDGFAPPPDSGLTGSNILTADSTGWNIYDNPKKFVPWTDPTNADLLLPSSAYGTYVVTKGVTKTSNSIVLLGSEDGVQTAFDTTRPISLNYDITIASAALKNGVVIPFALTIGGRSPSSAIPAGGWVATSSITRNGAVIFTAGQLIPAGFQFDPGDVLAAGAVLPISVHTADAQLIPAGTSFNVFSDPQIFLEANTAPLPVNALIPSNSQDYFGVDYVSNGATLTAPVTTLYLRPTSAQGVEGYLYPLAEMLPAGSQSWNMDFVAGANQAAADANAVQPLTTLDGGALTLPSFMTDAAPGSLLIDDQHYYSYSAKAAALGIIGGFSQAVTAFSVIRTGTGDLSLVAGGDVDQSSLYGIYTAGTQTVLPDQNAAFDSPRQALGPDGQLLPNFGSKKKPIDNAALSALITGSYQANYPDGGGDLLLAAQGNVTSDVYSNTNPVQSGSNQVASDQVGNWLWRQGNMQLGQPTSWWINFGTIVEPLTPTGQSSGGSLAMTGFVGFGALGGGNVTVDIGGNAGQMTDRDEAGAGSTNGPQNDRGEGLVIAIGSTGRLLDGSLTTTGGGALNLMIGGALNPLDATAYNTGAGPGANGQNGNETQAVNGDLIDIRGDITATAGAIGRIDYAYDTGASNLYDPRATNPYTPDNGVPNGGVTVVPGDGGVMIDTRRDLVLDGAGDPGRESPQGLPGLSGFGTLDNSTGGITGFTLWTDDTAIGLFSDGGNVTPTTIPNQRQFKNDVTSNDAPTDFRSEYPPTLLVTAATGDIIYGQDQLQPSNIGDPNASTSQYVLYSLETMPAPLGQVSFLAGKSIIANGYTVDISGADPLGLSLPADPAFATVNENVPVGLTNVLSGPQTNLTPLSLFALEADTPDGNLHEADTQPARFYAAGGDIVNFQTGQTMNFVQNGNLVDTWYLAAKPVWILASNDIVSTGTRPTIYPSDDQALFTQQENQIIVTNPAGIGAATIYSSGDLFLNDNSDGISIISAGRDVLSAYAYVIGSGLMEVDAGRNLYQAAYSLQFAGGATQQLLYFGSLKSLGADYTSPSQTGLSGGAGVAVLAGTGAAGPDYTAFADLYFDPANQANLSLPITDPSNQGKVQQVYALQLLAWLQANFGYTGDATGALAAFQALPIVDQGVFVREVFFDELTASGQQEANPTSRFYKDYRRGQTAIDTLLPGVGGTNPLGVPVGYTGGITAYSGPVTLTNSVGETKQSYTVDGGIATLFGGDVQILDPGGNIEFGIPGGPAPGNNSGIITYGSGDIDIYALDSVLLGKSRIFATGGGNITIWSSSGDINAGIGAKTTISYNPPVLNYDDVGDITQSPPASTSGAGIATLQPLPSVPAGNVSLIAPAGTVDAGEAGVRSSGSLVLAANTIANAQNASSKTGTFGNNAPAFASLGAVEAAGAAAGAATSAAATNAGHTADTREVASILDVDVISVGGSPDGERKRKNRAGLQ